MHLLIEIILIEPQKHAPSYARSLHERSNILRDQRRETNGLYFSRLAIGGHPKRGG